MMARGDDAGAGLLSDAAEEIVAHPPGLGLHGAAVGGCGGGHVGALCDDREPALGGERAAERLVLVGLRPAQAVVEVGQMEAHVQRTGAGEFQQEQDEGYRVRAAAEADHRRPRAQQLMPPDELQQPGLQVVHGAGPQDVLGGTAAAGAGGLAKGSSPAARMAP